MSEVRKSIIFCGDRKWSDFGVIIQIASALKSNFATFLMVEGEADGADLLSRDAAILLDIPYQPFFAHWDHHFRHDDRCETSWPRCHIPLCPSGCTEIIGRAAGLIRNTKMLKDGKANGIVAFHHDLTKSKGTADMVRQGRRAGLPVWVYTDGPDAFAQFLYQLKMFK